MLFKSSIASKHDLLVPLMANSDRPLLMSCIQHLKSLQQAISSEHVFIYSVLTIQCNGKVTKKGILLFIYPIQRNGDGDEDDGQTESSKLLL